MLASRIPSLQFVNMLECDGLVIQEIKKGINIKMNIPFPTFKY